ncbi:MAG: HNH nuclease family protein [Lysobacterales bacterium]|nr:MAG: HNH nuclease family protein [Xanthomonadales bacterium]
MDAVDYREQALKLFPWLCGRCGREFNGKNLRELTVHHKDHDHRNNPPDGGNWELLCIYCHEEEHTNHPAVTTATREERVAPATHKPFETLQALIRGKDRR